MFDRVGSLPRRHNSNDQAGAMVSHNIANALEGYEVDSILVLNGQTMNPSLRLVHNTRYGEDEHEWQRYKTKMKNLPGAISLSWMKKDLVCSSSLVCDTNGGEVHIRK